MTDTLTQIRPASRQLAPAAGAERPTRGYAIPQARARVPAIAEIIAEVAKETGLTVAMLVGDRRSRPIVAARHLAYWRAARETGASLAAIGRAFGDRDHTTIIHGIRKHEQRCGLKSPEVG
jgi:chromosomal replication initiation ATPase DnaA